MQVIVLSMKELFEMESKQKLFAFKLAAKQQKKEQADESKWKARDGVAIAGCTSSLPHPLVLKYVTSHGSDDGAPC